MAPETEMLHNALLRNSVQTAAKIQCKMRQTEENNTHLGVKWTNRQLPLTFII